MASTVAYSRQVSGQHCVAYSHQVSGQQCVAYGQHRHGWHATAADHATDILVSLLLWPAIAVTHKSDSDDATGIRWWKSTLTNDHTFTFHTQSHRCRIPADHNTHGDVYSVWFLSLYTTLQVNLSHHFWTRELCVIHCCASPCWLLVCAVIDCSI